MGGGSVTKSDECRVMTGLYGGRDLREEWVALINWSHLITECEGVETLEL